MGICRADPAVVSYCNDAQQRLLMDPLAPEEGWWGSSVSMVISGTPSNNSLYVTTPREVARLIVLAVCQTPIRIRNGFYEYLQFGSGLKPKTCRVSGCGQTFEGYERDNVVTLADLLSTPQTIRCYPSDARDSGRRVLIQGKDANGQVILNTDPGTGLSAPGEYVVLAFPFADTVNTFSTITGIQKDYTWGPVQLFQVDPSTAVETALSAMEPNEGVANYRRYLVNGIPSVNLCCTSPSTVQLQAQARLDFIPAVNETDYLMIQNVPALVEESMSIRYSRMDTGNAAEKSALHHARALSLLNGQLDLYSGKTNTAVKVPLFGSDRMRRQPV